MSRRAFLTAIVIGMIVVSGCVGVTTEQTVGPDGDLTESQAKLELSGEVYNFMLSSIREDGYDDMEEWLSEAYAENLTEYDELTTDHIERDDGTHVITVTITNIPSEEFEEISTVVDEEESTVRFEHTDPFNLGDEADTDEEGLNSSEFESSIEMTYVVHMPGEITDTNAHEVNESTNTATWNYLGGDDPEDIYVESDRGIGMIESMPGFGAPLALVSLFIVSALLWRRD